jgi:hypothetical protein
MQKKTKYNWPELKAEFINSPHLEVASFFRHKFGGESDNMRRRSKGWTKAKQEHQEKIQARMLEKAGRKEADEMAKALTNIRAYFKQRVSTQEELNKLKVQDARDVWKIIRIENNLPANIVKSHNINQDADPEDLLDQLDKNE